MEKNETKVMHRITFRVSNTVAVTTLTFQNGQKLTCNPIYFVISGYMLLSYEG